MPADRLVAAPAEAPPAVAPPPGNPRFPLFDSLRAIAALSVFLAHAIAVAELSGDPRKYSGELSRTGVCIFFLVSGFLLYRPFVVARWREVRPMTFNDFFRRRLLRIVPAYWLALAVVVAYYGVGVNSDNWLLFPAFGQTYSAETFEQGIGPAWTLCVEMTFYLLLPVYAWSAHRLSTRPDSPLADIVLLTVLAAASLAFHAHYAGEGDYKLASLLPGTFYWFALGMGLAVASVAVAHRPALPAAVRLIHRRPILCWALALGTFGLLLNQHEPSGYSGSITEFVLCGIVALFVLLPAVFGDDEGGLPRRILGLRVLAWVGLVSYGVYLWHAYVIQYVNNSSRLDPLAEHFALLVALALGATLAVAAGSYYLLEQPVLRLKQVRRSGKLVWGTTLTVAVVLLAGVALAADRNEPKITCRITETAAPRAQPAACLPAGRAGARFALSADSISPAQGKPIAVVRGGVAGHLDVAVANGATVTVIGWAASYPKRRAAEAALLFAGTRFIAAVRPTVDRPDVSEAAGFELGESGFNVQIPLSLIRREGGEPPLRVFAVAGDVASELAFDCNADPTSPACVPDAPQGS